MVKEIVFNYLSIKTLKMKKKICNLYIYKLFFEINPNTLSIRSRGLRVGVVVAIAVAGCS